MKLKCYIVRRKSHMYFLFVMILLVTGHSGISYAKDIPIGIYGMTVLGDMDKAFFYAKDNGFKVAVLPPNKVILDKSQSLGIKAIVAYYLTKEKTVDQKKWQEYLEQIKLNTKLYKNHPAVFAWYLVDEPDGQQISIEKIQELVSIVKEIDASTPIFTVLDNPKRWSEYIKYFDIIAVDPYLRRTMIGTYEKTDVVASWLQQIKKDIERQGLKKKLWVVLGAFDKIYRDKSKKSGYKKPSAEEFNIMVDLAMNENVDGILVYTLAFKGTADYYDWKLTSDDPVLWDAVRKLPSRTKNNR